MHPRNIAARNEAARRRIKDAAAALTGRDLDTMTEQERRDPAVAQMRELEIIAAMLEDAAKERGNGDQEGR